jgi:hypothetical protein
MSLPDEKYSSSEYLDDNPTWDSEDSPWKAAVVSTFMTKFNISTDDICEVGCGSGGVLSYLRDVYPESKLTGFDVAPDVESFWSLHGNLNIDFKLGDFLTINDSHFETILLLDVIEHLRDPFSFLDSIRHRGNDFVFHIPLDLSSLSILRETPLLNVRKKVGHIHYYTKNLALSLLKESGFEVVSWQYTNASSSAPGNSWMTKVASLPRKVAYVLNKDIGVRLLGGETLLIYARPL